jgi:hypothetical protein
MKANKKRVRKTPQVKVIPPAHMLVIVGARLDLKDVIRAPIDGNLFATPSATEDFGRAAIFIDVPLERLGANTPESIAAMIGGTTVAYALRLPGEADAAEGGAS